MKFQTAKLEKFKMSKVIRVSDVSILDFPIRLKVKQNFVITFPDIYRMYHEIQDSQTEQVQNVSGNKSI